MSSDAVVLTVVAIVSVAAVAVAVYVLNERAKHPERVYQAPGSFRELYRRNQNRTFFRILRSTWGSPRHAIGSSQPKGIGNDNMLDQLPDVLFCRNIQNFTHYEISDYSRFVMSAFMMLMLGSSNKQVGGHAKCNLLQSDTMAEFHRIVDENPHIKAYVPTVLGGQAIRDRAYMLINDRAFMLACVKNIAFIKRLVVDASQFESPLGGRIPSPFMPQTETIAEFEKLHCEFYSTSVGAS